MEIVIIPAAIALAACIAVIFLIFRNSSLKHEMSARKEAFEAEKAARQSSFDAEIAAQQRAFEATAASMEKSHASQIAALKDSHEKIQKALEDQIAETKQSWDEQKRVVEQQFSALAGEVLDKKSEAFQKINQEKMDAIVNPLNEALKNMRESVEKTRDQGNQNKAALEKAIEEMMKQSQSLGQEANRLANAMTSKTKIQGNWGEMILRELLDSQGLEEHKHYDMQYTVRDSSGKSVENEDTGKSMKPDVVVYYPDEKCVIIDSKVSLTAFIDYCNAEDDASRTDAATRHLQSVRQHVKELSAKDYAVHFKANYKSLPYVIMFMPNDTAFQLAMAEEPTLWREAFNKGVFITSEQNLIAALRMIQIAWTQTQQAQNQEKIIDTARMLLDRVADFSKYMGDVGTALEKADGAYRQAYDKLSTGRQSIVKAAENLVKLGARTSARKQLPNSEGE
ncbi:MAG: DNA recombination protein RmuC [Bacteroidales bacterium]|nr:DNA recombination protein RmuC [Bacteroidales bacterium]